MNRTVKKQFWLTKEEDELLKLKAQQCCLPEASLLRLLIRCMEHIFDPADYTAESGSVIVRLQPSYLEELTKRRARTYRAVR